MKAGERISVFKQLGDELRMILDKESAQGDSGELAVIARKAAVSNNWFTTPNVLHRLHEIARQLEEETLTKWLSRYALPDSLSDKVTGVINAGNIPAAGYDDFAQVLLAGHRYMGKLSSDDKVLLPWIAELIVKIEPRFSDRIAFTEGRLGQIDAVIATGSNNSSRYFEYYFAKYPHVIRRNRNSIAVLDGTETDEELRGLGEDIFRYFGLGCRNVTKLFVPEGYNFNRLFESVFHWSDELMENRKYMNNYEYNRTIYMLNNEKVLDNNFLVIRQDIGIASPPGVLFYEYYASTDDVRHRIRIDRELIQCVVTKLPFEQAVKPGNAQKPNPWDYADGVDILEFLLKASTTH